MGKIKDFFEKILFGDENQEIVGLKTRNEELEIKLIAAEQRRIENAKFIYVGGETAFTKDDDGNLKPFDDEGIEVCLRAMNPEWQDKYMELQEKTIEISREKNEAVGELVTKNKELEKVVAEFEKYQRWHPIPVSGEADFIVTYVDIDEKAKRLDAALATGRIVFVKVQKNEVPFWLQLNRVEENVSPNTNTTNEYLGISWNHDERVPYGVGDVVRFSVFGIHEIVAFEDFYTYKNNLEMLQKPTQDEDLE